MENAYNEAIEKYFPNYFTKYPEQRVKAIEEVKIVVSDYVNTPENQHKAATFNINHIKPEMLESMLSTIIDEIINTKDEFFGKNIEMSAKPGDERKLTIFLKTKPTKTENLSKAVNLAYSAMWHILKK